MGLPQQNTFGRCTLCPRGEEPHGALPDLGPLDRSGCR